MDNQSKVIGVDQALDYIRAGRMVIIVDDEDRENEGDLMVAAEKVTPEIINFMSKYGRGLICLSLTKERAEELKLPPMVSENTPDLARLLPFRLTPEKASPQAFPLMIGPKPS